jgi:1-acyl-sn-glycerol-3-phosphate acyltransferase
MRAWLVAVLIRPLCWLLNGPRIVNRGLLPASGPALIVANHNSDLDTPVLMSLLSWRAVRCVRVAAAADRFDHGFAGWLARTLCRAIPIRRDGTGDPIGDVIAALDQGAIVIFFPEGTRGEPEILARFRAGIACIARARPRVPVIPVALAGLGKSLPKGRAMPVPIECDVIVGAALHGPLVTPDGLRGTIEALLTQRTTAAWDPPQHEADRQNEAEPPAKQVIQCGAIPSTAPQS